MRRTKSIQPERFLSLFSIGVGISSILFSWFLFFLLPGAWVVILAFPLWLLVLWLLSRVVHSRGKLAQIRVQQHWFLLLLAILLALLSPICSYFYGQYHATRLFNSLSIKAEIVKEEAVLLDRFNQFDFAAPARSFTIQYQVQEPLDEAEAKLRQSLENRGDWYVGGPDPNAIYSAPLMVEAWCPRYNRRPFWWSFAPTGVALYETGRMYTSFTYEQPRSCADDS